MVQPVYPVADRTYVATPHIYARPQTPQEYAAKPACTVFADEQMILAAKSAAENVLGKKSVREVIPQTMDQSTGAHKVGYGNGTAAPININLNWYRPRPSFWEIVWQRTPTTVINPTFINGAQNAAPAPRTAADRAADKKEQEEKQADKNAAVALWTGIVALAMLAVATGYEVVKWSEARENTATADDWQRKVVGDNIQLGGNHPHANKLQELAHRFTALEKFEAKKHTTRLLFIIPSIASAALLAVGGYFKNSKAITGGWLVGGATLLAVLFRLGMQLAATKDKRKEEAREVLRLANELIALKADNRQLYYWKQGEQVPQWVDEGTVILDQAYENAARKNENGRNIYPQYASPPFNPASPAGTVLNAQHAASSAVDGPQPPPSFS